MSFNLTLGLCACIGWIAILIHAWRHPNARIWPPRRPSLVTVIWSWGLTSAIYVSIVRLGFDQGNTLALPDSVQNIGLGLAILGSLYHSWATSALGLKATSGWPLGGSYPAHRCKKGPYKHTPHPQYIGQSLSFVGLALFSGAKSAALIATFGCLALILAAWLEHKHLSNKSH